MKDLLRNEILKRRDALPKQIIEEKSQAIASKLFALPDFKGSKVVMSYVSFKSEVNTHQMIREALKMGKKVVVPFTDTVHHKLVPSEIRDMDKELSPSAMGILEPIKEGIRVVNLKEIDIVLVPGSVFDPSGGRVGFGYRYYDNFLKQLETKTRRVALAYELQIVDRVPMDSHDEYVDFIITEDRVICCKPQKE